MYNEGRKPRRRLFVASLPEDIPKLRRGGLIPNRTIYIAPEHPNGRMAWYLRPVYLLTFSVLLFALSLGSAGYSIFTGEMSVAAPIASIEPAAGFAPEPFNYGLVLQQEADRTFEEERAALTASNTPFIEVDFVDRTVVYYASGTPVVSADMQYVPETGSWWQVPAGRYMVAKQETERYSSFANIYLPWNIEFGENFFIHGMPHYRDGETVPERYRGGGVRLADMDAEVLYAYAEPDLPVLVRASATVRDDFLYEAKVAGVEAGHYLVADLKSSTVLAASDLDARAPIASLAKLMTALVAAEHMDLDRRVPIVGEPGAYVSSLVPRLERGHSASMYSLLQLLLLESSNEAAEVIARVLGRDAFIALMNEKAAAIGLSDTTFTDPSGLDDGNVSTVGDMLRLVQYIYENRGFVLKLTANQHLESAYTNGQFGQLVNFNEIEDVDFIAGKVGETDAAGQTSVSLHALEVDGEERVIAIVLLGTDVRSADIARLVSYVKTQFGGE